MVGNVVCRCHTSSNFAQVFVNKVSGNLVLYKPFKKNVKK